MKTKYIILAVSLCVVVFGIGIFYKQQKADESNYVQLIQNNYATAQSLEQLKEVSDVIVKGKYTEFIDTWNMSRDPVDIQKEDSEYYIEGKNYRFEIEEVIKGNPESSSIIVSIEALSRNSIDLRKNDYDLPDIHYYTYTNPLFIEPDIGDEYVLFLDYNNSIENFDYYYGAIEPFSIKIENNETKLQSNLISNKTRKQKESTIINVDGIQVNVKHELVSLNDFVGKINYDQLKEILSN